MELQLRKDEDGFFIVIVNEKGGIKRLPGLDIAGQLKNVPPNVKPLPPALCDFAMEYNTQLTQTQTEEYPDPLHPGLQAHQQKTSRWILDHSHGIVSLDMGLGKTFSTIAPLAYLASQSPEARFLVIVRASLLENWKHEFQKWAPHLSVHRIKSAKKANFDSVVTLLSDSLVHPILPLLKTKQWDMLIVDEAHCLKNINSARSKAVKAMASTCKRIMLLTGTPALSHEHLYGLLRLLHPLRSERGP